MKSLREAIQDYLSLRRSLGFKLHDAGAALAHFASFMEQHGAAHITTQLALAWAQESPSVQPAKWAQRLSYVRGFARHHSAFDAQTEVPPAGLLPFHPARARPYIYSEEEIERLLESALNCLPDAGLRSWTYYCLFGLLSVAGLRLGEAVRLELADVDLGEGLLTVRGTKFGKSRLVPIHDSTRAALARYRRRRERFLTGRAPTFFINSKGNRLDRGRDSPNVLQVVAPNRPARRHRQSRSAHSRSPPSIRCPDPVALVPRRRGCRAALAGPVDLPRACPHQ